MSITGLTSLERIESLRDWLGVILPQGAPYDLQPASADASFRRYFRATIGDESWIVMDAPPEHEDCRPFIKVASLLADAQLNAPKVLAENLSQGFLLLSDLGNETFLHALKRNRALAPDLFSDATTALVKWQLSSRPDVLPPYDRALLTRELNLFPEWYIGRHLGITLSTEQQRMLQESFEKILASNLAQPSVFVHRDYMPRNLMMSSPSPGILDFQDAVYGPITYDVASLFRDAFMSWKEDEALDWIIRYWEKAKRAGLPVNDDFGAFYRDLEWMGLQRHLKVLGIFARLNYRDGKSGYLEDTPRFVDYVRAVAGRYNDLKPLLQLFDHIAPRSTSTGYTF